MTQRVPGEKGWHVPMEKGTPVPQLRKCHGLPEEGVTERQLIRGVWKSREYQGSSRYINQASSH